MTTTLPEPTITTDNTAATSATPRITMTVTSRRYRPRVIARIEARRKLVTEIASRHGPRVTVRTVVRELERAGCESSLATVHRDLLDLGLGSRL